MNSKTDTDTNTSSIMACPRCGGQLLDGHDGELACLQCGYRAAAPATRAPVPTALGELARELGIRIEVHQADDWIARTERQAQYDRLIEHLVKLAKRGQGIRYPITPENAALCQSNTLSHVLRRRGYADWSPLVLDRAGWRWIKLVPRVQRATAKAPNKELREEKTR